jgi:hypothetical protein
VVTPDFALARSSRHTGDAIPVYWYARQEGASIQTIETTRFCFQSVKRKMARLVERATDQANFANK